jgi:hypothetical protein
MTLTMLWSTDLKPQPLAPRRLVLPPVLHDYEHKMRAILVEKELVMDSEEVGGRSDTIVGVEGAIPRR